jgi:hypothetical protein
LLSWEPQRELAVPWGALCICGACFCWAIDNNLTRKVSLADPMPVAGIKGLIAGTVNVVLAIVTGTTIPKTPEIVAVGVVGFLCYGMSLTCFVLALRHIGTARTGAYFSTAHWHDEHHQHLHQPGDPPGEPHSHVHYHSKLTHTHVHYPDIRMISWRKIDSNAKRGFYSFCD